MSASASSTAGMPSAAVGPKRASTSGETKTGSSLAAGAGDRGAGVDHRHRAGVAGAPLPAARAHLLELLAGRLVADPGVDLGVARREQDEARQAGVLAVRGEDGERAALAAEVELDPVGAAEDVALGGERELVPVLGSCSVLRVVLLEVGGDPQEPGRAPDQPHLVVAAPAAPVLDLDRGQRRLAGVAPVDGGVVAVDQVHARAGSGRATATSGTGPRRSCRRRGRSRRRSRAASSGRASARRTRSTHSAGGTWRSIAASSAGSPKASKPKPKRTASPRPRRKRA